MRIRAFGNLGADGGVVGEVIEVAVRQPQADHVPPRRAASSSSGAAVLSGRVEEHGHLRRLVGHKETVRDGDAAGVHQDLHV